MGFEDWENKYRGQGKPHLSDFLDDEEDNVILRVGRPYPQPSHTTVCPNTQHHDFLPATYPEGYDTIDRRRKKKIRDPGGLSNTEADKMRKDAFPSDLALLREKRGQVAKMQEEEEHMTSCLRPYKNGLLYKARMWAKNGLDNTLENYVAYKKEQDARMRAQFEFDLESSENLQYSSEPEEDINIDDIAFLGEDTHQEKTKHYKDRYSFSYESHVENSQGIWEKKGGKARIGGWAPEPMLSPVEEPSDEYVDPMDELQCLVETVSEYLAEKEEEISKYGSLPKSSKSRLSSQGSNRTDSFGEDQNSSSKDPRIEKTSNTSSAQGISGVKNVMSSLFSSLTDRVGGSPKQPVLSPQAPSVQPPQPGLTKLFSFIPKSNSSAPVAVVSPVESSPEKLFSSFPSQQPRDAETQLSNQETKASTTSHIQTTTKEHVPEFVTKPQSAPGNTILGKFNPLKLFSAGDNGNSAEYKQSPEFTCSHGRTQWNENGVHQGKQLKITEGGGKFDKLRSPSQERHMRQNDENLYGRQNSVIYKDDVHVPEPARPTHQTQSANSGFLSPLKKSLSSLMPPAAPVPPQGAQSVTVYPVFRSTEDPRQEKTVEGPPLTCKPKLTFLSSENLSTQQRPKAEVSMLSGFLKLASSEDDSATMNTQQQPVRSYHESPSTTSTIFTQKFVVPQENTEKGWFSSIFNPTSTPTGSNQNSTSNLQSQKSRAPPGSQHTSVQKSTAAPHGMQQQTPSQPESQSFLTGLFKGSSADGISHMGSNQPKQGGLLSGLLKFGSTSDLSGSLPQQASHSNQPPRFSNPSQFPHHPAQQQNTSPPQMGGVLSGLSKFSSAENIPHNVHHSEAENQRIIPGNYSGQQQTLCEVQQTQPHQKGLLSDLLKFAPSENIRSSQTVQNQQSNQHHQEGFSQQNTQGPNQKSHLSSRTSSQEVVQRYTSKQGFTRQQTVPLQQPPSQRTGVLSGLFKFASADNISSQHPSDQQHGITPSKSSHDQTQANQPQKGSTQKTQVSGLLSGLFKSSSENVAQQQPEIIHERQQQNKVPHCQTAQNQMEAAGQSAVLSGLFNKLAKSSENIDPTYKTSTAQSLHQKDNNFSFTMKTPLQTQSRTNVTQLSSQEHAEKEKIPQTVQQKFLPGLFSKNVTENPGAYKQVETPGQITEQQTPSTIFTKLHSGISKNATLDLGMHSCQTIVPDCLNPGQSRHALFSAPVSIDTESLDLRTSATFARSLQSQATYSSISTGNLSQLYYSGSLLSVHPGACSTGNIHSSFESHAPSSVMQPYISGSTPSLYEARRKSLSYSPYGISPSYDENQWISESVLWQQFQNESLNYQLEGEDQGCSQNCECTSLQTSALCCSSSNINQSFNSPTWQGIVCHQEQIGPYQFEGHRNDDLYSRRKLWNSYEDLRNIEYSSNEDGALNLTTKQINSKFGKRHSFNDGSTYSLNGVSYHEGYYEETAPSLSYSANWQYDMNNAVLQNPYIDGMIQHSNFNLNPLMDLKYPPNANTEAEDSLYLEDTEWYQQWLALLEQGMWWAADDGDCGYFVYTDHEYIYALLTDAVGEYVYACVPEDESWGNAEKLDMFPSAWLHNEMILVCGFKIPLYNEDELLWLPGQDHSDSQLLNAPLDLSAAYRKGNQIMNLNLEQFSQMFENSFMSQGQQGVDFTSYRLNKVRMDPRQPSYVYEDQCKGVIDLSCHNKDYIGPYWNNQDTKTFLAQKVAVSLNSTPTANSNQHILYNCYQPSQQRRSSTGVTVKHVDDVSDEEWRKRVFPGEQQPNRQAKTISSLISSFVGKASQVESNKTSTSSCDQVLDKHPKNILSSGFQSLKSKIIKEESNAVVSQAEIVKEMQRSATSQGRMLPTAPTTAQVTHPSTQFHTTLQKPRLSRQATMVQQAAPPTQPSVTMHLGSKESLIKPVPSGQLATDKPVDIPVNKQSEQPQAGFMNFLKSAVGIEETKPDHQKSTQISSSQQSKTGSTASLAGSTTTNKEGTGVSNLFGSISSLFSTEPSPPQKQQMKPSVTEGSLTSASRPKGIQRQQTMDQSGTYRPAQSQLSSKSVSQVFSPNSSTGSAASQSETMPSMEQTKHEAGSKPSGGLFRFSIGEMLTAAAQSGPMPQTPASPTAPQEESLGKSILSMFSGPNPPQTTPKTEPLSQAQPSSVPPQSSQQESLSKSLLSMFGGSSPSQPSPQSKPTAEAQKHGTVPPKEPSSTGFLSMFGGTTTQHSQAQTGSLLGGILSGSANSTESPVKGLLSMFSDSTPPQSEPSATSSQQRVAHSQTQHGEPQTQPKQQAQPQAQGQPATSVLGGILGGLSASSESPRKALFSMFSGPSTPQTPGAGGSTNMSSMPETAAPKEPAKNIPSVFKNTMSPPPQTPNLSSTIPTAAKETTTTHLQQGASQISSVSISPVAVPTTTCEISSEFLENKASTDSSELCSSPSTDTTVDTTNTHTNSATIKGANIASVEPTSECVTVRKETSAQSASQDPASNNKPPASGLLSMISKSDSQTSSSQVGYISDGPAKSLLSLFSGSSTEPSASQTGHSPTGSVPGTSEPKDPPAKGLFSVFGGSASQPSSQPGSSLLGAVFGGSSLQIPASQTGGSLLGGLFRGSAPPTAPQVSPTKNGGSAPHTAGPQAGASLLGGLFGSAPQAGGSQAGGSVLGGIFGGASTAASQTSGSFSGMFSEGATQTSTPQNSSSILGNILGGSSSQTGTVHTSESILSGILPGSSVPNEIPGKSLLSTFKGSVPPSTPTATTTPPADDEKKTLTTALTNTTPGVTILPKCTDDSKAVPALVHPETSGIDTITKSKEQAETLQQRDSAIHCHEASLTKTDSAVIEEVNCQVAEKPTALVTDIESKESESCAPAQQPTRPQLVSGQSSQATIPRKVEEETPDTQSSSPVVQGLQKPSEPEKSVGDSSADTVTGFMSSLFKLAAVPTEGPQQPQKTSLFGLGGTSPQAANSQTAGSLLGGIFGGSTTQTAAPQAGGSLLGGLFKGSTPQSGPQTTAPISGGSILGGMFGGGPTAKSVGPHTGGSLLGGMFGGSTATAQSGGSLLGGMFGGVTAQTAGSHTGASVLGGIGGSLFGQAPKPSEPMPTEPKPTTTPQPQIKNETVASKVSPSSTETSINKMADSTLPNNNQIKSDSLTSSSVMGPCRQTSAVSSGSISTACDLTHQVDNTTKEKPAIDGEVIHEKPMVIKEDPESRENDTTAPSDNHQADPNLAPQVNQLPSSAQLPQAKSPFEFIPTQSDAGKSCGSLFSPIMPLSVPSMPQTEAGSGLFSGIKTLSGSLFKEEKHIAGKQEPPATSLFSTKIGFPWQAEPPKPQNTQVVTSQPKTNNMPTSDQTHTVQKVATSDAQKHELVGSTDDIVNPQICISTPEVDPSASLTPTEMKTLVETYPSAGPTSGVELDKQSKKDLLIAKRLVKA